MRTFIVTLFFVFTLSGNALSQANELPKCSVTTLRDAQFCMNKVASLHTEYNQPNIGSASTNKTALLKVLRALGMNNSKTYAAIQKAAFVGVMLEKGDEWYLYYYAINAGQSIPINLGEVNLVDLTDIIFHYKTSVTLQELILGDAFNRFDATDRKWIQEYLDLE